MPCPLQSRVWRRIPGYDSSDSTDDDEEESGSSRGPFAGVAQTARRRLKEVSACLGDGWGDFPTLEFRHAPPSKDTTTSMHAQSTLYTTSAPGFRIEHTDAPAVLSTMLANGMSKCPQEDKDWLIQWSGPSMRDEKFYDLGEHQRVNHFPGSYELTRKDRLWTHFEKMGEVFGEGTYDFVPQTFVLPDELDGFLNAFKRQDRLWIVKPHASSRGRGIFILRDLADLPMEETSVVSEYLENPLLIQGLKFDLRVYVLVTSYDPLCAYIYREGLVRFATMPYSTEDRHLSDAYRHLTNYSINKLAPIFMENKQVKADNVGHKWSLSALNRHLKCVDVDVDLMWVRIMDLIVKSLLSVQQVISAKQMKVAAHPTNCFELYGFDVMVDDNLKPWLIEVNLSPSMQADSPLDWQIKTAVLKDTFNLLGVSRISRSAMATQRAKERNAKLLRSASGPLRPSTAPRKSRAKDERRPQSAAASPGSSPAPEGDAERAAAAYPFLEQLAEEQLKQLGQALKEIGRCRNFIQLYPTRGSVERYAPITKSRLCRSSMSKVLASLLFDPLCPQISCRRSSSPPVEAGAAGASSASSASRAPVRKGSRDLRSASRTRPSSGASEAPSEAPRGSPGPRSPEARELQAGTPDRLKQPKRRAEPRGAPEAEEGPEDEGGEEGAAGSVAGAPEAREAPEPEACRSREPEDEPVPPEPDPAPAECAPHWSLTPPTDPAAVWDALRALGTTNGCRLLAMEYLLRFASQCSSLAAGDRAKWFRGATVIRLAAFRKRLAGLLDGLAVGQSRKKLSAHHERAAAELGCRSGKTDGLDEVIAVCNGTIYALSTDAKQALASSAPAPAPVLKGSGADAPADAQSALALHLPPSFAQSPKGARALALILRLTTPDLEQLLASARCAAEFRALLEPSAAPRASSKPGETRAIRPGTAGSLRPRRPSTAGSLRAAGPPQAAAGERKGPLQGPLSELLAAVASARGGERRAEQGADVGPGTPRRQCRPQTAAGRRAVSACRSPAGPRRLPAMSPPASASRQLWRDAAPREPGGELDESLRAETAALELARPFMKYPAHWHREIEF